MAKRNAGTAASEARRHDKQEIITRSADADQAYGSLAEGVHIAGYSLERAWNKLEWLLEADRWKAVGRGFDDINAFLDSIKLDSFRMVAESRKRIASRIKELQPEASNRQLAKLVGVDERTMRRDVAANAAAATENPSKNKESQVATAAIAAPTISGAVAAKSLSGPAAARLVGRRETGAAQRLEKVRADEQRVLSLTPITGRFRTIIIDPAWEYDWLSEAARARTGYAMQTHEQLLALDVRAWADEEAGCHLYCWVTNNFMARACELIAHWGFQHRGVITWIKPAPFGLGNYFRNSTEHVLFATLGETTTREAASRLPTHFEAERGEHSEKPDRFYEIVRAASYPPYGEANQREARPDFVNLFELREPAAIK
ncbi:N6-adenosine-specific RNA methylase IME4 [Bradyrhizobium sp. USDA 4509]